MRQGLTRHKLRAVIAPLVLIAVTTPAMANPGAAVAMASISVLIVGTLAMCLIETIVALVMKAKKRSIVFIPIANVLSLFFGLALAAQVHRVVFEGVGGGRIGMVPVAAWTSFLLLAILGVLIEWPVFRLCVRSDRPWRRSMRVLLVAAGISNLALALIVGFTFDHRLATTFHAAPIASVAEGHRGALPWVYFLGADDRTVSRIRLDGTGRDVVYKVPFTPRDREYLPPITLRAVRGEQGEITLVASLRQWGHWIDEANPGADPVPYDDEGGSSMERDLQIPIDFAPGNAAIWERSFDRQFSLADLRGPDESADDFTEWMGFGAIFRGRSLNLFDSMVGNRFVGTGYTALPGGLMLFEFMRYRHADEPRGVMLLSVESDQRAKLVEDGWCPVVLYPEIEPSP